MSPSRRDARIERKNEKRLRDAAKSARLREQPSDAIARTTNAPAGRQIRAGADPGSIFRMIMEWTIDAADRDGAWSWGIDREWSEEAWEGIIRPKLAEFEKLRWAEIEKMTTGTNERHRMHHLMDCDVICHEACTRLSELSHEHEQIFRFRLGNKRRLWGFRIVNVFELLWYDPTHQIYPTEPD